MLLDNQLLFSDAQAITATAVSTNVIDTAPFFSGVTGRALGVGKQLYVFWGVDTAFTDSGSDSTVAISVETDDNASMSSATTLATMVTLAALSAAGTRGVFALPSGTYERYIAVRYTLANGNLTTGAITSGLTLNPDQWTSTVGGFTTGVE